ncbi:Cyclin-dependent kinase-like [Perkinsus olseni]|uniref:Cyclin-dependent kinase-like n=1 Tax=Perkinsus olseni TaxID=32597 RepID=A0A7J6LEX1_PEROL|nr:Cyclin-dependent kinase-like [Perkinsus olseni]
MEKYDTLQTARVRSPAEVFFGEKPPEYVAIKKFRRPVGKEESVERTAARETRLLSELKHPNIIEMLEVVRTDKGNLYLIFEFAPQTLLDLIERCSASDPTTPQPVYDGHPKGRGIGLAMTMTIGRQLVAGLGYIHSKGVIHRDVKPENILLTGERLDVVKLCDFGFARYLKEADTSPSKEGAPHAAAANLTEYVSTRWYRAPELLLGPGGKRGKGKNGNYEQSIDVWALGCVVAECDTGEPAFTGDSDVATLKLINDALPVPLPATRRRAVLSAQGQRTPQFIKDRYSPRLHAFLRGCLQYSPSERLACVDLAPLLVGLPDSAVALDSGRPSGGATLVPTGLNRWRLRPTIGAL